MKTEATERRFLLLSAGGNVASASLGLVFAVLTSSQAILLDGVFRRHLFHHGAVHVESGAHRAPGGR